MTSLEELPRNIRVLARHGLAEQVPTAGLVLGEIAYAEDTRKLFVGDGTGDGHVVAEVIEGPHDQNLYAKIEGREKLIPLGIRGTKGLLP